MSLSRFKESLLRPCSSHSGGAPAAAAAASSGSSHPTEDTDALRRKPPKSSLSQQLQRLDEFDAAATAAESRLDASQGPVVDEVSSSKEGGAVQGRDSREEPSPLSGYDFRGPFEPLILSSPGDLPLVQVPLSINCRLLEHQRVGVQFLYGLYKSNHGGVLGDDMGLGKTIQTIAFLAALAGKDAEGGDHKVNPKCPRLKGPIMIICPTSVIQNWENELSGWTDFCVAVYHGPNRDVILERLGTRNVEIIITSFDTFRIHDKILLEIPWDIIVFDEAHRLKNEKSQLYKSCLAINTRNRIGLTGTVMQNKILEFFNLFDWVSPGCLGTREHFREFYDEPLKHGQRLGAPERFVQVADMRKQHLVAVLQKYLLRRTKEETIGHLMLGKEDNVVFCSMSDLQKRVYKRMLEQPEIRCLMNMDLPCSCGSPLTQVECCHRTVPNGIIWSYIHRESSEGCDSCPFCIVLPCISKLQQISNHLELIKPNPRDEVEKQKKDAELVSSVFGADINLVGGSDPTESFMGLSDAEHCGKMQTLERLLCTWTSHGDKILLFSYSVRMLDIIEKLLIRKGYCFSRLDGSTPMSLRQSLVDEFNRSSSKQVFLISTRAGGLGLNLVSASRVVIFDPNWNPAQDLQAQDRSFRYGQKRHVVVYRLLAAGSLEELVYSRQVYKQQLSNIAVSGRIEKRYFEGVQDSKVFKGELFGIRNIFRDLSDKLFTMEILELHWKSGEDGEKSQEPASPTVRDEEPTIESLFIDPKLLNCASLNGTPNENGVLSTPSETIGSWNNGAKPSDLGILSAHRHEDVLNVGPASQRKNEETHPARRDILASLNPNPTGVKRSDVLLEKREPSKDDAKLREYALIARYVGMEVLEFSRWTLSASPDMLNKTLQDYYENKRRKVGD